MRKRMGAALTLLTVASLLVACGVESQPAVPQPTANPAGSSLPAAQQTANLPVAERTDGISDVIPAPISTGPVVTLAPPPPTNTPRPADWTWRAEFDAAVSNARATLAKETGVTPESIKVIQTTGGSHPHSSGGCYQTGSNAASQLESIAIIVLESGGKQHTYLADNKGHIVNCVGKLDKDLATVADKSKTDLAQRLKVDTAAITLVTSISITWADSSIGCPTSGGYAQVLERGYFVVLEHEGRQYDYHILYNPSNGYTRLVLCQGQPAPSPVP